MVVSQKWSQLLKAKRGEIQVWAIVKTFPRRRMRAHNQSINAISVWRCVRSKVFWSFILPGAVSLKQIFEDSASAGLLFCRWNIFWKRDWWPRPGKSEIQPFPPVTNHCKYECFSWLGFLMFFAMENQRQQTQMVVSQKWSQLLKAKRGEIQVWAIVKTFPDVECARTINQSMLSAYEDVSARKYFEVISYQQLFLSSRPSKIQRLLGFYSAVEIYFENATDGLDHLKSSHFRL